MSEGGNLVILKVDLPADVVQYGGERVPREITGPLGIDVDIDWLRERIRHYYGSQVSVTVMAYDRESFVLNVDPETHEFISITREVKDETSTPGDPS